jgi:hypothetical protein
MISLPLVMTVVEGERYLVSMLGPDVNWVRNNVAVTAVAAFRVRAGVRAISGIRATPRIR